MTSLSPTRRGKPGFVSYLLVLSTAAILTLLMVMTYNRASDAQALQKNVQLRLDYSEKEDAILRAIVAITPNRAIRAMQNNSNAGTAISNPLRWENIFTEALVQANARTSIPPEVLASLNIPNLKRGNTGDSALATPNALFRAIGTEPGFISVGTNRSLDAGYPPPLTTVNATTIGRGPIYPIITADKVYGALAQGFLNSKTLNGNGTVAYGLDVLTYKKFNILKYPNINFGYARPGDPFVAKRNWWAFSLDVAAQDFGLTRLAHPGRDFVLSIYEVPSQLAISASSFMELGKYASGDAWGNVTIAGGVFVGKALVEGRTAIGESTVGTTPRFMTLASRRGMTVTDDSTIKGVDTNFTSVPFQPGVREVYQASPQQANQDAYMPVSLSSESGRVAFVPINRGVEFFDRFHPNVRNVEGSVLSPTTWNNYSVGALQCAMRLDITQVSATDQTPTMLHFSYMKGGTRVPGFDMPTNPSPATPTVVPGDYIKCAVENETYDFKDAVVDVAYGKPGGYSYLTGVTGKFRFDNATFNDPLVGTIKSGFFKTSYGWLSTTLAAGSKRCVGVYPQRFAKLLKALQADTTENNSLVVNVDYNTNFGTSTCPLQPSIPCADTDPAVILQECADLTSFPKGFSLVTNLRTYIGEDFNVFPAPPPAGYTPASGQFFPPCSIFAPEKRYGVVANPLGVDIKGQIGSLASDTNTTPVRPLDSKNMSEIAIGSSHITVNLRPIVHPCELPPITMMNWLVVLEERRKEFVGY